VGAELRAGDGAVHESRFRPAAAAGAVENVWTGCGFAGGFAGGAWNGREGALVSDAIRAIREAEADGVERERQARAESKRLIADAHESIERLQDEMRRSAREAERALTETARAEAEKEAAAIAEQGRAAVQALTEAAEGRVRQGVARVLEAIVPGS
jgi:vacuolar-type H+-ATPase subunit H